MSQVRPPGPSHHAAPLRPPHGGPTLGGRGPPFGAPPPRQPPGGPPPGK